jgi:hypothetical protein
MENIQENQENDIESPPTEFQKREYKIHTKVQTKIYKQNLKNFILTSRFNNHTMNENAIFRKNNQKIGCIYCSPIPISSEIPIDKILFILEMNNDTNKIIGIGMIRNHTTYNKYSVYDTDNYNRYIYIGKYRIDRSEMTPEEDTIMRVFDILCFTGNKHMKRGNGLKTFPTEMLYRCSKIMDLVDFINTMFKKRISSISVSNK